MASDWLNLVALHESACFLCWVASYKLLKGVGGILPSGGGLPKPLTSNVFFTIAGSAGSLGSKVTANTGLLIVSFLF